MLIPRKRTIHTEGTGKVGERFEVCARPFHLVPANRQFGKSFILRTRNGKSEGIYGLPKIAIAILVAQCYFDCKTDPLMSLHVQHTDRYEVYFCTFTCYKWLPLFEESKAYTSVYRWFNHLNFDGCKLTGYVIMPNHVHVLLFPTHSGTSLNKIVGDGKRFMAYDIVKGIRKSGNEKLLQELEAGVERNEKRKGKIHQVFHLSFDARICYNEEMVEQKLEYIHHNPGRGKWTLVDDFIQYPYSSARFYELGEVDSNVPLVHYKDLGC